MSSTINGARYATQNVTREIPSWITQDDSDNLRRALYLAHCYLTADIGNDADYDHYEMNLREKLPTMLEELARVDLAAVYMVVRTLKAHPAQPGFWRWVTDSITRCCEALYGQAL